MSTNLPAEGTSHREEIPVVVATPTPRAGKPPIPYAFEIVPEPSPEEASVITAALISVFERRRSRPQKQRRIGEIQSRTAWKAARRPRPTPHLIKGIEPSLAWKLSGLIGKPFGR